MKRRVWWVTAALAVGLVAVGFLVQVPVIEHRVDATRHVHQLILREGDSLYSILLDADHDGDGVREVVLDVGAQGGLDWWRTLRHGERFHRPRASRVARVSGAAGDFLAHWPATPETVFDLSYGAHDEVHVHQDGWVGKKPCLTHRTCFGGDVQDDHREHVFLLQDERARLRFEPPPSEGLMGNREGWDLILEREGVADSVIEQDAWPSEFMINESLLGHGVILKASHSLPRMGEHLEWLEVLSLSNGARERFWLPENPGEFRMDAEGSWARIDSDGHPALGVLQFEGESLVANEYVLSDPVRLREVARFARPSTGSLHTMSNLFEVAELHGRPLFLHLTGDVVGASNLRLRVQLPDAEAIEHTLPIQSASGSSKKRVSLHGLQWASCRDQDMDGVEELLVIAHYAHGMREGVTWTILSGATGEVLPR